MLTLYRCEECGNVQPEMVWGRASASIMRWCDQCVRPEFFHPLMDYRRVNVRRK